MQYRNRILIGYFIGIVLIIVSDKYNFGGFNVPKVLREAIYIYGTLSLIGIVLTIIYNFICTTTCKGGEDL